MKHYTEYNIDKIRQRNPHLCWEACGRILYRWKHGKGALSDSRFNADVKLAVGSKKDQGLLPDEMDRVYSVMGMDESGSGEVEEAFRRSPVIWYRKTGHACVMYHFNSKNKHFHYWDPFGDETLNLDTDGGGTVVYHPKSVNISLKEFKQVAGDRIWSY